jgi:molybdate/tungstate transport system substrate-binding protein
MKNTPRIIIFLVLAFFLFTSACHPAQKKTVVVFAAGSLIIPFGQMETAYEAEHPDIDLQMEYHGSIQVIRHATELHEPIDVVATADASLIPMLMYATNVPDTDQPYASWYIRFATNKLALAYSPSSKYAGEINADNWYEILSRPDVKVGVADPRFDASGYRAMMTLILAQDVYSQPTIFENFFSGQFTYPVTRVTENGRTAIHIPEILETKSGSHVVLRGASIQLIALIESGDLDYAFEYESVIRQHNLQYVSLPDQINLGSAAYNDTYGQVEVRMDFQRFQSINPVFIGEQIGYGITIPSNAPHPAEAADFIAFVLGPEGQAIMQANHHPLLSPLIADHPENMPAILKALLQETP